MKRIIPGLTTGYVWSDYVKQEEKSSARRDVESNAKSVSSCEYSVSRLVWV